MTNDEGAARSKSSFGQGGLRRGDEDRRGSQKAEKCARRQRNAARHGVRNQYGADRVPEQRGAARGDRDWTGVDRQDIHLRARAGNQADVPAKTFTFEE